MFSTRDGEEFTLRPGDVLLAEDTAGSGHQWRLEGTDPWRRMYVVLAEDTEVPFVAGLVPRDDVGLVDLHRVLGSWQE